MLVYHYKYRRDMCHDIIYRCLCDTCVAPDGGSSLVWELAVAGRLTTVYTVPRRRGKRGLLISFELSRFIAPLPTTQQQHRAPNQRQYRKTYFKYSLNHNLLDWHITKVYKQI